jgi:hypothetical protein
MSDNNKRFAVAIKGLAQEVMALTYRANITEQLALRLLEHLAKTDKAAALRLVDEVKQQALGIGNPRDNPVEAPAQERMLELLNNALKAAKNPRE